MSLFNGAIKILSHLHSLGIVDQKARPAHIDSWHSYLYIRRKIPGTVTTYFIVFILMFYIISSVFLIPTTPHHTLSYFAPNTILLNHSNRRSQIVNLKLCHLNILTVPGSAIILLVYKRVTINRQTSMRKRQIGERKKNKFLLYYERSKIKFSNAM